MYGFCKINSSSISLLRYFVVSVVFFSVSIFNKHRFNLKIFKIWPILSMSAQFFKF